MAMTKQEASQILGVPSTATQKQVNEAYRKAIAKYHPDANRNKSADEQKHAEIMFKKCSQAKKVMLSKEPEIPQYNTSPGNTSSSSTQRSQSYSQSRADEAGVRSASNTSGQQQTQRQTTQTRQAHNKAKTFHDNIPKVIDDAERQIAGFFRKDAKGRYSSFSDNLRATPSWIPSIILLIMAIVSFISKGEGLVGLFNGNPMVPFALCMLGKILVYDLFISYYIGKLLQKAKLNSFVLAGIEAVIITIGYLIALGSGGLPVEMMIAVGGIGTGIAFLAAGFIIKAIKTKNSAS